MSKRFLRGLLLALAFTIAFPVAQILAQEADILRVSPALLTTSGSVGERITLTLDYTNVSVEDTRITFTYDSFVPGADGIPDLSGENPDYDMSGWFDGKIPVSIKAGETVSTRFAIDIPADAKSQTYYGLIRGTATISGSSADVSHALGSIVLLDVNPADKKTEAEYESFTGAFETDEDASKLTGSFDVAIKNTGDYAVRPDAFEVQVSDDRGAVVKTVTLSSNGNVLPKTTRVFTFDLAMDYATDKSYTATVTAAFPDGTVLTSDSIEVYTDPNAVVEEVVEEEEKSNSVPIIAAGVTAGLLAIAGIVFIILEWKKSRTVENETTTQEPFQPGAPVQQAQPGQTITPQSPPAQDNSNQSQPPN